MSNDLVIEKNVPIPKKLNKWQTTALAMEIGDSVVVRGYSQQAPMLAALKSLGRKGTSRRNKEDGMIRVWRIK